MLDAKVILDSISPEGYRFTTLECTFHRFILPEVNTYRNAISRNSASSRAIPISKNIAKVIDDTAFPVYWGKNQSGMTAQEELTYEEQLHAKYIWMETRDYVIDAVKKLSDLGLHKQTANRLLEPFLWHTAIITVQDVSAQTIFNQRIHPDAQPEFHALAKKMKEAYDASTPQLLHEGEWHMPYIKEEDREQVSLDELKKISIARCARVSYLSHDGIRDLSKDIELFDKLNTATPPHLSPFEHVATPCSGQYFNFCGWKSLRYYKEKGN
jgi:hypothetical protein